jgi:SAM-dependent methyltransferase
MGLLESVSGVPRGMRRREFIRRSRNDRRFLAEWGAAYEGAKNLAIGRVLDSRWLMRLFASNLPLPPGYGLAFDERVVELPWVMAMRPSGRTLDAGSALNQRVVLDRLLGRLESLTATTFTPQSEELVYPGVDYVAADLRQLPFADGEFETVVSVSTLEHVGMDNSEYGSEEAPSDDPDRELRRALLELNRVLQPGGRLLLTVPYGREEDHRWLRQFDRAGLERIAGWFEAGSSRLRIYRHSRHGWQRSGLRRAADSHYRDHREEPAPAADCTFAAQAVACLELRR